MADFTLHPFPGQGTEGLCLSCVIERPDQNLTLSFALEGNLSALAIAGPEFPVRADNLWHSTCFEMFWAEEGQNNYWELNLAPSGSWNAYAFAGYRKEMRREERIPCPASRFVRGPGHFVLTTELALGGLHQGRPPLTIGLCAVLADTSNHLTYWALAHPGPQPDFHAAAGFLIHLP